MSKQTPDARSAAKKAADRSPKMDALTTALRDSVPPGSFGTGPDTYQRAYPAATQLPPVQGGDLLSNILSLAGNNQNSGFDARPLGVDPNTVMSVQPPAMMPQGGGMSVQPPPETVREGVPASLVPPPPGAQMAAGGAQGSSPAAQLSKMMGLAGGSAQSPAQPAANGASAPPATARQDIAELLKGKQALAEGDRDAAKAKAEQLKGMTDEEKVFMSLMSVMPGLLGGLIGGAVAGPTGASAGAAGGLQGAAGGVGMYNEAKQAGVKDAQAEAEKAQGRVDQAGNQGLMHQEKLGDQAFHTGERVATQQHADENLQKTLQNSSQEHARDRAAHRGDVMMQLKGQMDIARVHEQGDLNKAQLTAKTGNQKVDDTDVAFYNNTGAAMRAIHGIDSMVQQHGADLSAVIGNPEARSLLKQSVAELAHAYTKIGDPNSAVLLAELENTTETMLGNPDTTRTRLFMNRVHAMQEKIVGRANDYSTVRPQIPVHPLIQGAEADPNISAKPKGGEAHAQDAEAVAWAKANPTSPHSRMILQINGIQ